MRLKKISSEEKILWIVIPTAVLVIVTVFVEHAKMSAKENERSGGR